MLSAMNAPLHRDVPRIFLASLFILVQVLVSFSLIPLYILHRGGTTTTVAAQTTLFAVASILLRFFFGPMADTRGRKPVLAIGTAAFALGNISILYAPSLTVMAAARVVQAVGMASYLSAASSLVADRTPRDRRGRVIGAYRMMLPLAFLIGPFIGNEVINRFGFSAFFYTMAGMSTAAFLIVLTLSSDRSETVRPGSMAIGRVFSLFASAPLRAAYIGILVISIGGGIIVTYAVTWGQPYFPNAAVYFPPYALAGAVASYGLGALSDRLGRRAMLVPPFVASAVGIALLTVIDRSPVAVFFISAALTGIGYNAGLSVLISAVVDAADDSLRATALSLQESWIDGGFAVGIFLFGTLSAHYGMAPVFLGTGLFVMMGYVIVHAHYEPDRT